jgi:thioredoxin-related protein
MKKLFLFLALTALVFAQTYQEFAQGNGYELDYKTAISKAKSQNKELMLLLVTNYCPWCKKYEQLTLSNKEINAKIHSKYVPLIINREERNFPAQFDSTTVPITYFVNPKNEKIVESVRGYQTKDELKALLK